jgi:NRAMP (natural resistance-associated macrophage protein)-like metal ion transporter
MRVNAARQFFRELFRGLGPGLITGAADDDPSGIATYSQAGAQFRFGLIWTLVLATPLMISIQMLSARIGWVTGRGLGANIKTLFPRWFTISLVSLFVAANTINIAADIAAMGEAVRLFSPIPAAVSIFGFGTICVVAPVFFSYERSVRILKWLTLALFAYVAVILTVKVPWWQVTIESLQPWAFLQPDTRLSDYAAMVVAVMGTTISPYLFFWQASQEAEDDQRRPNAAKRHADPRYATKHLGRIRLDTTVGMVFSNLIALCIVIATAVTLNLQGITEITTSAQAALALRPVAGDLAFVVFGLGIIGTGLLAVPVLAGSAAYAVSEVFDWNTGLSHKFNEARGFYLIIIAATGVGSVLGFYEIDPIKMLVWSAIINGVIAVPIMVAMLLIGQSDRLMGRHTITMPHRVFGWLATVLMAVAVVLMFIT